jgi:type I restriction enzyme S subunit
MSASWPIAVLRDHYDLLVGFAFKSEGYCVVPPGIRVARGDNVTEGQFRWGEKTRFWPEVTDEIRRYLLKPGDVLVGMDGSKVGRNWTRVRKSDLPCLLVQRVACLRARASLDQGYLALLISSDLFKSYVDAVKTGSSIPHISGGQIGDFAFPMPPLNEQRAIAHILGTLDDKIELNRRMNETLEEMARALFKSTSTPSAERPKAATPACPSTSPTCSRRASWTRSWARFRRVGESVSGGTR